MTKTWFPQRNSFDSSISILKTFMHYVDYPISRSTIEDVVESHAEFPSLSFLSILDLLQDWGMEAVIHKITAEDLNKIPSPSITLINEKLKGIQLGIPIVFFKVIEGEVLYCHPRKGWVYEDIALFELKWCKVMISLKGIEGNGETDFYEREKAYDLEKQFKSHHSAISTITDVLSNDDCDYIIALSKDRFLKSLGGAIGEEIEGRSSHSAYLNFDDDERLNKIRAELAALLQIELERFEYFQCVSYTPTQEYQAHYDTFETDTLAGKKAISAGGQRHHTLLVYLNDDFEGGQTYFPLLDLLFSPEKGSAVFFDSQDESKNVIESSFHAGLPVSKGKKYALNLWIREKSDC